MKFKNIFCFSIIAGSFFLSAYTGTTSRSGISFQFPYKESGLTDREAAAHLLSRFTYGATPGQVDAVVAMGLENWFQQQLEAKQADDVLDKRLSEYDALTLSNAEIVGRYQKNAQVLRQAIKEGAIEKESINKEDKKAYRAQLLAYMQQKGIKPERELIRQFINQKIVRAAYTNNQLQEVMTEFWFNHFNVSFTKNICGQFIPGYERDVIRPNALGSFEELLMATAKSPAMLLYLDNFSSVGVNENVPAPRNAKQNANKKRKGGLNENYAREVMELHTLGVDGGYTQKDVTEAARVLTGWTIYPMGNEAYGNGYKKLLDQAGEDKLRARGFVHEGDFLFTANRHDSGDKSVLGKKFNGQGYQEGVQLLHLLATHESTSKFISKKIATRFVNDTPSATLIDAMSKTFESKKGNIKQVLITMVSSPEFWSNAALRNKTKSPFELALSTVRALNAEIKQPYQIYTWITRMGEQKYFYQAPTGFPDKGQYWINTGSLLNRMNFGLALADGRVPGVKFDLLALNKNHEPESAENALQVYSQLIMPGRSTDETIQRLTPLLNDPELQMKIDNAAAGTGMQSKMTAADSLNEETENTKNNEVMKKEMQDTYRLSQVVGILIGSPEFQRR